MTFSTLIRRSLRYHWRAHLGVLLGAATGSAALIGALVVGDSVKGSLKEQALKRLAGASVILDSGDRFFQADLGGRIGELASQQFVTSFTKSGGAGTTQAVLPMSVRANYRSLLSIPASVTKRDGGARANQARLICVWNESSHTNLPLRSGEVLLNRTLARQLGAQRGDELLFRIAKPSALSREITISTRSDLTVALRLRVAGTRSDPLEDFDPVAGVRPTLNAFVLPSELEAVTGLTNAANYVLFPPAADYRKVSAFEALLGRWRFAQPGDKRGLAKYFTPAPGSEFRGTPLSAAATLGAVEPILKNVCTLKDLQYDWATPDHDASSGPELELRTPRIFIDPPVVQAAATVAPLGQPVLTYLVNLIQHGTNNVPYSMVTAAGMPWTPADLKDDEIILSQWLANDMKARPGDELTLSYFDPESGTRLTEKTNRFRVRGIVPAAMPWNNRTLMPDFPGIQKAESTSDWDAGFPLTYKIRPQDEAYWKEYRGTPKAFVTLAAGQKMWGNRFGNVTGIRFAGPAGDNVASYRDSLEKKILARLSPEQFGLRLTPAEDQALAAADNAQDFGGLFIGFSFFLIGAALLLMAMLLRFGLEQRAPEIGTLLAVGFTPKQVRRLLLREGGVLALLGGGLGAAGGVIYAKAMLRGLTTIWSEAVGGTALSYHVTPETIVIGSCASVVVSAVTLWWSLRKFARRPARELLVGDTADVRAGGRSRGVLWGGIALCLAVATVGWTLWSGETNNAESFFSAGSLVLVAGLTFVSAGLAGRATPAAGAAGQTAAGAALTLGALGLRGSTRRRKRSLATIAMLACGSFLIASLGVFRLDANRDAGRPDSGTGGFALVGDTTTPVVHDLNSPSGRDFFALNDAEVAGVRFVPFRVRQGDEASCLNLNAAPRPRLLGVNPERLAGRFAFAKLLGEAKGTNQWLALRTGPAQVNSGSNGNATATAPTPDPREIPAIGDANSIQWAMHKKVGDTMDYVDERGQPFKVRIVGAVANSILQGQLIIDEAAFVTCFPGESGYRMFLIDAPSNAVTKVSATLSRAFQDVGLELTPAPVRLEQFNAVQNTYLGTFQVLGGLGLLLGSVGLGIVVLRNVLERRGELALLLAVGFRKSAVQRLVLIEHGALLMLGLLVGLTAAAVAVLPALLSPGAPLPYGSLGMTLGAVLVNGLAWTGLATRWAVRGDLLRALRNE